MSDTPLTLVSKSHMFDQVYDLMLEQITSGNARPGERIKDTIWAERFGVSRTPIREAMRKLTQEGLLVALPNGGYEVRRLSAQELVHLYSCRAALEGAAAREVAAQRDPVVLARIEKVLRETADAIDKRDLERAFDLNTRYHEAVLGGCANGFIGDMLQSLQRMIKVYRRNVLKDAQKSDGDADVYLGRLRLKQEHHERIFAAISAGDEALSSDLMMSHVKETVGDLLGQEALQSAAKAA